jgi:hypothetical protein
MSLILWTLISFKFFSSFKEAEKKIEIKNSFINKPNDYEKIRDVTKHPTLKSFKDKLVSHE